MLILLRSSGIVSVNRQKSFWQEHSWRRFPARLAFAFCIMSAVSGYSQQLPTPHAVGLPEQLPTPHMSGAPQNFHTGGVGFFEGPYLAASSLDGRIFATNDGSVWSVAAGGVVGALGKELHVFTLSARGTWLAFAEGKSIKIWTFASGEVRELAQADDLVEHMAGSPDETTLAVVSRNGAPQLFQVSSGERLRNFIWSSQKRVFLDHEAILAFSPDGTLLACGSEVWTVSTGKSLMQLDGRFRAFTSDGRALFTLQGDHAVAEWNLQVRKKTSMFDFPALSSNRFTISPDGTVGVLAQPMNANPLSLWDTQSGLQSKAIDVPPGGPGIYNVSFLGSSDWMIAGHMHARPLLVRVSTGEVLATLGSDRKNWSVVRAADGAYDASPSALTVSPRGMTTFIIDKNPFNRGGFEKVDGLLSKLPGAPTAAVAKPHTQHPSASKKEKH